MSGPHAPLIQFGKYLLDGEIATGGMSKVFRARLRGPGGFEKRLVVKQILPQLAVDPNFIRMFVQEANTLVQMSHPNIVPVYELGVVEGVYFLAMELVEGATLLDILREGPLPEALVAHMGIQICDALHYAHDRCGVIHRDVTPRNLVIDDAGHARLLDFGIAAPADQAGRFGSLGYMSPEQAQGLPLGPRSDLFSVGTLLFEALGGRPAYLRDTAEATRRALLEDTPPTLSANVASEPMREWVKRCLAHDEHERPRSAAEVARGLRALLAASHPAGVAEELGRRAHEARLKQQARAQPDAISTSDEIAGRSKTPGNTRTLATSPILDQLLQQQTERIDRVPATAPAGGQPGIAVESGTAPIVPTATASTPIASTPATSTPDRAPAPTSTIEALDRQAPGGAMPAPGSVARVGWVVATLGLVGLAVWALRPLPDVPARQPTVSARPSQSPLPSVATAPHDTAPAPQPATQSTATPPINPPDASAPVQQVADAGVNTTLVPARAALVINAVPWADVKLDGRALGSTPLRRVGAEAGKHTLELSCPPLGRSARVPVSLRPNQTLRVLVDLNAQPPRVSLN